MCMYACMQVVMRTGVRVTEEARGIGDRGSGVIGSLEPPSVRAVNKTVLQEQSATEPPLQLSAYFFDNSFLFCEHHLCTS